MSKNARTPTLCLAVLLMGAVYSASGAGPDAREILERVYQLQRRPDVSMKASFEIYDRDGHRTQKKFTYRRISTASDSRTLVEFVEPEDIRGVALLSINQPGAVAQQYIYIPATQRVRSVAPQQRSSRFIGTDLTFEDVQEHDLNDFSYRLLDEQRLIDGHKTFKIEATPVSPQSSQYQFVDYWVAQDVPVILYAEMYDAPGTKVRVQHATDLRQVAGIWGARRTVIQTVGEGTRTVLNISEVKFNTGLDARQFTPEALEKPLSPGARPGPP